MEKMEELGKHEADVQCFYLCNMIYWAPFVYHIINEAIQGWIGTRCKLCPHKVYTMWDVKFYKANICK